MVWCVSSEDQSSCLRQTGCNQACHIDHHQALLHHRRSIHHCIGGAAHSLVTAPPLLGFRSKTSTNRPEWPLVIDQLQVGWSCKCYWGWWGGERWKGWRCTGSWECDSPSEWQTGRHFSAVRTPKPPTPRSAPNLFCCPFDLGLCPVVTFDNSQAENCVLSFSNRRPYIYAQHPPPPLWLTCGISFSSIFAPFYLWILIRKVIGRFQKRLSRKILYGGYPPPGPPRTRFYENISGNFLT